MTDPSPGDAETRPSAQSAADADAAFHAEAGERAARRRSEKRDTKKKGGALRFLRDVVVILVAAVVISALIQNFLIRSFYIPSESMEPTLYKNDRIIVNRLEPRVIPIEHGDVVVFTDPGGWLDPAETADPEQNGFLSAIDTLLSWVGLSAPDSNDHLIKRVIGLPGDHVTCCNTLGQMSVNGIPLDEGYVQLPDGEDRVSMNDFDVTVPADSLWVMGDNRWNSSDSRAHQDTPSGGFVPISDVVGRAFVISWPSDHWGWLDDYPLVFAGVDEAKDTSTPPPSPPASG